MRKHVSCQLQQTHVRHMRSFISPTHCRGSGSSTHSSEPRCAHAKVAMPTLGHPHMVVKVVCIQPFKISIEAGKKRPHLRLQAEVLAVWTHLEIFRHWDVLQAGGPSACCGEQHLPSVCKRWLRWCLPPCKNRQWAQSKRFDCLECCCKQ